MTTLLTGASGFLGRILQQNLQPVLTLGRSPGSSIPIDLAHDYPLLPEGIDRVVHNAGKAHTTPRTDAQKMVFFDVNYLGTVHLLKGLDRLKAPPRQFVLISTVAVYGRDEGEEIAEDHPLEGQTPYAVSKILAEQAVQEWAAATGVPTLILRLPLVAGPHPPGNLGAIRRAIAGGYYVRIRGNAARKSIVLGEDVARLIATLAGQSGVYNLTDGVHPSFAAIEDAVATSLNRSIRLSLPLPWLRRAARIGDRIPGFPLTSDRLAKMTASLTFSDARARQELGWAPRPALDFIAAGGLESMGK